MRKELLLSGAALVVLVLIGACTAHGPIVAGSSPSASTTPSDSASSGSSQSPSAAASASPTPTATPVQAGPGTWQPGPEMSSPRTDFAAVALPRGGVLLIGGESTFTTITASADIFDPTTNTIHPAAPMSTARSGHTATLLPNGKVLVVGGFSGPGVPALGSAELYDPATNSWTLAAAMNQPRAHHAAVLMGNGKVFVTGGEGGPGNSIPSASEIYDPGTNTWTSAQTFYGYRPNGTTATVLKDGRLTIYGGVEQVQPGNSYEFYDPATGRAAYGRFMGPGDTSYSTVASLEDGTVIIVGGQQTYNPTGALNATAIFNPALDVAGNTTTDAWSAGPAMDVGHCRHTMTTLRNGLLLVAGGRCGSSESIAVAEPYDPVGKRWLPAAPLLNARGIHTAVLLPDGRVLVAGGSKISAAITDTTEIYTPA